MDRRDRTLLDMIVNTLIGRRQQLPMSQNVEDRRGVGRNFFAQEEDFPDATFLEPDSYFEGKSVLPYSRPEADYEDDKAFTDFMNSIRERARGQASSAATKRY